MHLCVPYAMGVSLLDQADRLQHALLPKLAQAICALVHPGRQARIRLDALDEEVVGPMLGKQFANG